MSGWVEELSAELEDRAERAEGLGAEGGCVREGDESELREVVREGGSE